MERIVGGGGHTERYPAVATAGRNQASSLFIHLLYLFHCDTITKASAPNPGRHSGSRSLRGLKRGNVTMGYHQSYIKACIILPSSSFFPLPF